MTESAPCVHGNPPGNRPKRDEVSKSLRALLDAAAEELDRCQRAEDAVEAQLASVRDTRRRAQAERDALARAIASLEHGPAITGRPRGSTKPDGTREKVAALLPTRKEWRGRDLTAALADDGHVVPSNHVTAALAALTKSGDAVRVRKGWWAATSSEVLNDE